MGTFDRLERIVRSWTGQLKRERYYTEPDIFMMLTDLGMQMKPETLERLCGSSVAKDEIAQALYAAEAKFGRPILRSDSSIDPVFEPRVLEEGGRFGLSLSWKGKEYLIVDLAV